MISDHHHCVHDQDQGDHPKLIICREMDALQSERSGLASGTPNRQGAPAPFQTIPRLVDLGVLDDPSLVAHDVLFQTIPRLVDRGFQTFLDWLIGIS